MKREFLDILRCPVCKGKELRLEETGSDDVEIRTGKILCSVCGVSYAVDSGMADFLKDSGVDVKCEQEAVDREEYLWDAEGERYRINKANIEKFREQFLALPEGDGSHFFKRGGCFQPIAEGAHRFYSTLEYMQLKTGDKVLALGDGFGYASYKFAQRGSMVVALDISSYLLASDLYIKDAYFDRVFSDMHDMPFKDALFDIVYCSAVLHHSKELEKVFFEIRRVLKPGGRLFVINESSRGVFERVNPLFEDLKKRGYSDTAYTIPEWVKAARSAGFKGIRLELLSIADDYIARQINKNVRPGGALRLAYFFKRYQWLEKMLLFLLKYPRILFRPRSWRMVCWK